MRTNFDLNLLIVLDALLTTGSVSAAAQALDMTQSAVSHALRRLRTHFNDPLLVRAGNRMLATPRLLNLQPLVRATLDTLYMGPQPLRWMLAIGELDTFGRSPQADRPFVIQRRLAPQRRAGFVVHELHFQFFRRPAASTIDR